MSFTHHNVIFADDDSRVRERLRELFRAAGCSVVGSANNTDDLMLKAEQLKPDVVVLDISLTGTFDPLVALARLRKLYPRLVVFVMGTMSENSALMEALSRGAVDFFIKPIHGRTVQISLQQHLP